MKRKRRLHVWILVFLVNALFALSVMAPREWRSVAVSPLSSPAHERQSSSAHETFAPRTLPRMSVSEQHAPLVVDAALSSMIQHYARVSGHAQPAETQVPFVDRRLLTPEHEREGVAEESNAQSDEAMASRLWPSSMPTHPMISGSVPSPIVEIRPRAVRPEHTDRLPTKIAPIPVDLRGKNAPLIARSSIRLVSSDFVPTADTNQADISRQLSESLPEVSKRWPYSEDLANRLEALVDRETCGNWCREVVDRLHSQSALESLDSDEVLASLTSLRELQHKGFLLVRKIPDPTLRSELARAVFALARRLEVWSQIHTIASVSGQPVSLSVSDAEYFRRVVGDLEAKLAKYDHGQRWHDYLLIDEAKRQYCSNTPTDTAECRRFAKRILLRLDYSLLRPEHSEFLAQREMVDYSDALRQMAAEPVDYFRLMDELERYEKKGIASHALHLAAAQQILRWSRDERVAELGRRLDSNYRNANIRIAIGTDLIRRLTPDQEPVTEVVDDFILGARTWGCSETQTQLGVVLLPSPINWKIGLRAEGQVVSETCSTKGPATFRSLGDAVFLAEKQIVIDAHGIYHKSADADAESSARLTGLATNLDPVPIVGDIVQAIAEQRYKSQAPAARWEMENIVATRARSRLDTEVTKQLKQARRQFVEHFYQPMEELALNPMALEMRTTEQHLVARYRLAGHHQLAAHTPRPIAPKDSELSVQIHESAINNVLEQFRWEGKEADLRDLYLEVGKLFDLPECEIPEEFPDGVTIRFAREQPVRFTFADSRVTLQLSFAELKQGRKRWRNFSIRVHYQPAPDQPEADLVRDQYVELIGQRLRFGDQIALRGIFSRVFAKNQPVDLISKRLADDPRMQGLVINQLDIGDGWLGLSVGPKPQERRAQRAPFTRR